MGAVSELECSACGWSRATRADDDGWVQTADGGVLCELCSHDAVNPGSGERGGEGIVLHCPSCGQIQDRAAERVHVEGVGDICPECAARRLRTQRCLECARDISESDCFCFFHEAWWCDECIRSTILECASCRRTTTLRRLDPLVVAASDARDRGLLREIRPDLLPRLRSERRHQREPCRHVLAVRRRARSGHERLRQRVQRLYEPRGVLTSGPRPAQRSGASASASGPSTLGVTGGAR